MTSVLKNSALAIITLVVTGLVGGPLAAAGDAEAGEKVFERCKACHQIGGGAKNRAGPVLTGVVGNPAGMADGYKYSKALKAAGENGLVWSDENLTNWLMNPSNFMKEYLGDGSAKSKMSFKLKKPEDAANIIAYLATFSTAANESGASTGTKTAVSGQSDAHGEYGDVLLRGPGMRTAENSKLPQPGDDGYEVAEYSTAEDLEYMEKVIAKMKELHLWSGP